MKGVIWPTRDSKYLRQSTGTSGVMHGSPGKTLPARRGMSTSLQTETP